MKQVYSEDVEDKILFCDEEESVSSCLSALDTKSSWKILIVDDEKDIHTMTRLVLRSFTFDERPIEFHSAYSGEEAKQYVKNTPDIAVIFLDVVMEHEDSGLDVVRYIREELKNTLVRIILRTGQPGYAPEESVTISYDINDYKEKSELTKPKLFACLTTAIRSYRDISTIELSRTELHRIIVSAAQIFRLHSMKDFCQAVLQQLSYLLNLSHPALHLQTNGFVASYSEKDFVVLASIGTFSGIDNTSGDKKIPASLIPEIQAVIKSRRSQFRKKWYIAYFESECALINIVCIECQDSIDPLVLDHIQLFNMNVGIAFNNLHLNKEIIDTQKELIYSLGEIVESRSRETCYHIHRVSDYTELLCSRVGMPVEEIQLMKIASVMHDVGKMSIPDAILKKPGKLTSDEFSIMKTHAQTGYKLLQASERLIFKKAAEIALSHHERWDGNGYPQGLKGNQIPLSARIVAIADVFDALSEDRVYRKAWDTTDVIEYIKDESGKAFDPELVEIFMQVKNDILAIQSQYVEKLRQL